MRLALREKLASGGDCRASTFNVIRNLRGHDERKLRLDFHGHSPVVERREDALDYIIEFRYRGVSVDR